MSAFFKKEFGVRQGSVLSPHLFAVLLDDMVAHLTFRNKLSIVLYADDILLLAPSVSELQRLACCVYVSESSNGWICALMLRKLVVCV